MSTITRQVIDSPLTVVHDAVMNLHRFLLIDSVLLDIAGMVALVEGETELGLVLLAAAAMAFLTGFARRRLLQASSN